MAYATPERGEVGMEVPGSGNPAPAAGGRGGGEPLGEEDRGSGPPPGPPLQVRRIRSASVTEDLDFPLCALGDAVGLAAPALRRHEDLLLGLATGNISWDAWQEAVPSERPGDFGPSAVVQLPAATGGEFVGLLDALLLDIAASLISASAGGQS